ncbi:type II toxin-antitoxin system VapC family toxin [Myceligenerans crystallogenes]|uniref:Ribonuclease VapC n=1 Tax=Myceligenerans crystallogenes TaxID=316335 RepID=A0ABN2NJ37_9MICO
MPLYLLDTNVISELRKKPHRRDDRFNTWLQSVTGHDTYLSVITVGELTAGVLAMERKDPAQGALLRSWLEDEVLPDFTGRILPVTREIAEREARLQVPDPRPKADALIAATALTHNMTMVTRNTADFSGTGTDLVNPWDAATH